MIDAAHRAAALQYGRPFRVTLPVPAAGSSAIERAHGVFCYALAAAPVIMGTPRCGWIAGRRRFHWSVSGMQARRWVSGRVGVVIQAGACQ